MSSFGLSAKRHHLHTPERWLLTVDRIANPEASHSSNDSVRHDMMNFAVNLKNLGATIRS
jgi:hypothetical protein